MLSKILICLTIIFTPETLPDDVGTYLVEYSHTDGKQEIKTVSYATVVSKNTIICEQIALDAQDFSVSSDDNITVDTVLLLSKVKAWNVTTLEEYKIDKVEIAKVNDRLFKATIYSFNDISVTININVKSEEELEQEQLHATKISNVEEDDGERYLILRNIGLVSFTLILGIYVIISLLWLAYNKKLNHNIKQLQRSNTNVK